MAKRNSLRYVCVRVCVFLYYKKVIKNYFWQHTSSDLNGVDLSHCCHHHQFIFFHMILIFYPRFFCCCCKGSRENEPTWFSINHAVSQTDEVGLIWWSPLCKATIVVVSPFFLFIYFYLTPRLVDRALFLFLSRVSFSLISYRGWREWKQASRFATWMSHSARIWFDLIWSLSAAYFIHTNKQLNEKQLTNKINK